MAVLRFLFQSQFSENLTQLGNHRKWRALYITWINSSMTAVAYCSTSNIFWSGISSFLPTKDMDVRPLNQWQLLSSSSQSQSSSSSSSSSCNASFTVQDAELINKVCSYASGYTDLCRSTLTARPESRAADLTKLMTLSVDNAVAYGRGNHDELGNLATKVPDPTVRRMMVDLLPRPLQRI
ncbi:hypothetical protein H6P81_017511 [Aristolochia fimbriata]|uniref:Pectinesterase inhibitor domain-containing protein n=1 Tax=Aristolochia fimbriata TaxID=158543 RepID=A0AAV7E2N8_ARIFI|nr:hypothetical protein H6P81_017511 [Aristolochia fimbriata]